MKYILSIGGSGAKCGHSLVYAAAAGLIEGQIALRFLDIDSENGNSTLARDALGVYAAITELVGEGGNNNGCFNARFHGTEVGAYLVPRERPAQDQAIYLDQFVNQVGAPEPVKKLYDVLFDPASRKKMNLRHGVQGRPNFGQVILSRDVIPSEIFPDAAQPDQPFDLFLFGSIFGGTGAAGLPTMAKIFRGDDRILGKKKIGAAVLLPYFNFSDVIESPYAVASNSLGQRSAVALDYYSDHYVSGDPPVFDILYYIGKDPMDKMPIPSTGGDSQRNPSSIVELFAALYCEHFFDGATTPDTQNKPARLSEFVGSIINWKSLPVIARHGADLTSRNVVRDRLAAMYICCKAFQAYILPFIDDIHTNNESWRAEWYIRHVVKLDRRLDDNHRSKLELFCEGYTKWIEEMQSCAPHGSMELVNVIGDLRGANGHLLGETLLLGNERLRSDDLMHDVITRFSRSATKKVPANYVGLFQSLFDSCLTALQHSIH